MADSYRNVYQAIRAVPMRLAELSWSMGLPLRPVPAVGPQEQPVWVTWLRARNITIIQKELDAWNEEHPDDLLMDITEFAGPETEWDLNSTIEILDAHRKETTCGEGGTCKIHAAELAHLIETSPQCPEVFFEGQTIDTGEETIRQEAARLGLVIRPLDNLVDENDDMLDDVRDEGYQGAIPFWFPDARIISMIAWERAVKMSGENRRIYPVITRDGNPWFDTQGVETPEETQDLATKWVDFLNEAHGFDPQTVTYLAERRKNIIALSRDLRTTRGRGIQIIDLIPDAQEAPEAYFETDLDPYRDSFHETDMDMHDVWVAREELSDREIRERKELGLPPIGPWRVYTRGRNYLTKGIRELSSKIAALDTIALHPIHVDQKQSSLGSDHDMSETEWDLGTDVTKVDIETLFAEQEAANKDT